MPDSGFARLVSLACHDLRTPLATVTGFAKTLARGGTLPEREAHFVDLIDAASGQMAALLDLLALAARIESGRWEPVLAAGDTLELARADDVRVAAEGTGAPVETDTGVVRRALAELGRCAAVHGGVDLVTWSVDARTLTLAPVTADAAPVVSGETPRDLGALVARRALEALGGSLAAGREALRVTLPAQPPR